MFASYLRSLMYCWSLWALVWMPLSLQAQSTLHHAAVPVSLRDELQEAQSLLRNDPEKAYALAWQTLQTAEQIGNDPAVGLALSSLGDIEWRMGNYDKALGKYLDALHSFRGQADSLGIARALQGLAKTEWRYGNYPEAMSQALQSLYIREKFGTKAETAESYLWAGIIYAEVKDYEQALRFYDQALRLARDTRNVQLEADALNQIGRAWRKQEDYEKARNSHEASRILYESLHDSLGLSDYYNNVGSIFRRQNQNQQALDFFFQALKIQEILGDQEGLADGYNDIGTTYSQMGNYAQALSYLRLGLQKAEETGLKDDVRYAYASMAQTYDRMGNTRLAERYAKLTEELEDSLVNAQTSQQLSHLQIVYESERRQHQIDLLKAEERVRSQRNYTYFLAGMAILIILAGLAGFMYWRTNTSRKNNRQLAAKNRQIEAERERAESLLLNILPEEIAEELKNSPANKVKARTYPTATVLFTDFKGFTKLSEQLNPRELIEELDECFRSFDDIIEAHGLEKIKTIGDAYMAAAGVPVANETHAVDAVRAGLAIQAEMKAYIARRQAAGMPYFRARLGIHSGPIIAGVVGKHKFAYDIWGDTVNTASRMESSSQVGKVNISQSTYELVQDQFICHYRGKIPAKNKGEIDMYFVEWEI